MTHTDTGVLGASVLLTIQKGDATNTIWQPRLTVTSRALGAVCICRHHNRLNVNRSVKSVAVLEDMKLLI